jgi:hypothetical protein
MLSRIIRRTLRGNGHAVQLTVRTEDELAGDYVFLISRQLRTTGGPAVEESNAAFMRVFAHSNLMLKKGT